MSLFNQSEYDITPTYGELKICTYCKKPDLEWIKINNKWVLSEDGIKVHECLKTPQPESINNKKEQ